ncbi:alkene reductase [Crocosphaera chwakensis]|uniref:Xenobiotic reductase B n=1 Tax=Crocosphaera chwakensis CCY0110 TaxID=391612 RepID=A3IH78_9CHRO|nr:alkene reductase [Crocosphaera chwakensis]EAZ94320.1 xenobiotic reductase B [Crocosphaera chwakensis CCY0110]
MNNSHTLFAPCQVGNITLKNRVIMAPLTRSRAGEERMPNDLMKEYYMQRKSAGLIISEATVISRQGCGWVHSPGIYSDEQMEAWKPITQALHEKETPIFLQLWHCGRASHSSFQENNQLPVSASAIKLNEDYIHTPIGKQPYETPRALETEEIPRIVEDYRLATERAKNAGFDGVEIHSANGYLIDQFLQSKTNHRSDKYGGSIENRYRFLKEIVEAVLTVFPANKIAVRLSPNGDFNDMGSPEYRELFTYVAQQLNNYDLAYLHIIDGLQFGFHELGEPMTLADFRQVFDGVLMGNCGYSKDSAEAKIREGNADLIAFGRPFISNPDLVERFANNWPLNPPADMQYWYSFDAEGYIDFPTYEESKKS